MHSGVPLLSLKVDPPSSPAGPGIKALEETLASLFTPLILLHLYPRALLQLTLQTVSSPSTAFSIPTSTDPLLQRKGKGKEEVVPTPRGVALGASERAATINAAMMAVIDAGVQSRGMLVAVAVAFVPRTKAADQEEEEEMVLDPSPADEDQATSSHVFAFSFGVGVGGTEGTCVCVDSVGTFSEDQVRSGPIPLLSAPGHRAAGEVC